MNSGHHKVKKERNITDGDSGRDQEGQEHGGTILSMAQLSKNKRKKSSCNRLLEEKK